MLSVAFFSPYDENVFPSSLCTYRHLNGFFTVYFQCGFKIFRYQFWQCYWKKNELHETVFSCNFNGNTRHVYCSVEIIILRALQYNFLRYTVGTLQKPMQACHLFKTKPKHSNCILGLSKEKSIFLIFFVSVVVTNSCDLGLKSELKETHPDRFGLDKG